MSARDSLGVHFDPLCCRENWRTLFTRPENFLQSMPFGYSKFVSHVPEQMQIIPDLENVQKLSKNDQIWILQFLSSFWAFSKPRVFCILPGILRHKFRVPTRYTLKQKKMEKLWTLVGSGWEKNGPTCRIYIPDLELGVHVWITFLYSVLSLKTKNWWEKKHFSVSFITKRHLIQSSMAPYHPV